jgi:apolipoprotein N-acyltransferase
MKKVFCGPPPLWLIILSGFFYGFLSPPLNGEYFPVFFFMPIVSTAMLLVFFQLVIRGVGKRGVFYAWIWGVAAVAAGSYWILEVDVVDIPFIMPLGLLLMSLVLGIWYMLMYGVLRASYILSPKCVWWVFPALWVLFDYTKSLGQLSFPWHYAGYTFAHFLPFAQLSALTGIWGMNFWVLLGAALVFQRLLCHQRVYTLLLFAYVFGTVVICLWGYLRLEKKESGDSLRVAVIQSNIDNINWRGWESLEESLRISERMLHQARQQGAHLAVLPESGVFTYLSQNTNALNRVHSWTQSFDMDIITGALDRDDENNDFFNGAFYFSRSDTGYMSYYKHKLVPYGESMPFEGLFPMINHRDLGGSDFTPGEDRHLWSVRDFSLLPYICYEAIYPSFIQARSAQADILVNLTNDRWFGFGVGPYQHKNIARLRAVENGLPLIRSANNGISFIADSRGRIITQSSLGTREVLVADIYPPASASLYARYGNWFLIFLIISLVCVPLKKVLRSKS